jgi:Glycosyl hydrolase catalytic core
MSSLHVSSHFSMNTLELELKGNELSMETRGPSKMIRSTGYSPPTRLENFSEANELLDLQMKDSMNSEVNDAVEASNTATSSSFDNGDVTDNVTRNHEGKVTQERNKDTCTAGKSKRQPRLLILLLLGICLLIITIVAVTYSLFLKKANDKSDFSDESANEDKQSTNSNPNNNSNIFDSTPAPSTANEDKQSTTFNPSNNSNIFESTPTPSFTTTPTLPPQTITPLQPTLNTNPFVCTNKYPPIPRLPGKKGIGEVLTPETYLRNIPKIKSLNANWYYDWGLEPIPERLRRLFNYDTKFVPMVWSGRKSNEELRQKLIDAEIPQMISNGTVTQIFGFNEPDSSNQANMTVAEAIERWAVLEALNVSLVSPSCKQPMGEWMIQFMKIAEQKCLRIDSVGVHWYGAPNITSFQNKMRQYYQIYKKPLSITEFAPADWQALYRDSGGKSLSLINSFDKPQVLEFMKQAITWLEETEWILSYSWFIFENNSPHGWPSALFSLDNNLTTIGRFYKSITVDNVYGNLNITYKY